MERHNIKGNEEIERLCNLSRLLYNKANFFCRQRFFGKMKLPGRTELVALVRHEECFNDFGNTKIAKQVLLKLLGDWSNYFKSIRAWAIDKSKFRRRPQPPKYKAKMAQVIFYNETIRKKPLKKGIIQPTNDLFQVQSQHCHDFRQVIITPKTFGFVIEVSYEVPTEPKKKKTPKQKREQKSCFIDLGVNNLCAITSDQPGLKPVLINGRIVKSINQWFNKNQSKKRSKKRYWRLENYFHHVSKFITEFCKANGLSRIIIGRNDGWKQGNRIGKKNGQAFQSIPFYKLIEKISFKALKEGIEVIFTEEAWTSQASFFDGDAIPVFVRGQASPEKSGERVKRGLYQTADRTLLNADVNGSLNIGRKVIGDGLLVIADRSVAATPEAINPLKWFSLSEKTELAEPGLTTQT